MPTATVGEVLVVPSQVRPWWRQRWLMLAAGFCGAFLVGMAYATWVMSWGDWSHGAPWERRLIMTIHHPLPPPVDAVMLICPWFGTNLTLIPAVGVLVWWLWVREKQAHLAVRVATVQLGSYLLNPALKALYDRARPDLFPRRGWFGWTSYPSGHAIASVSVLLTVALILRQQYGWTWPFFMVVPILVASLYSRIYLGVHWPTDVIGGLLVGTVWLVATAFAFRERGRGRATPSSGLQ